MKICDTLLPNGMSCHHQMEDLIVITCEGHNIFN
jgi:hypothetical protein